MNNKTKIIIGVGIAALLFMFRKNIFGGNGETTDETFVPDTTGPSETVEAPKETSGDTALKPFAPSVPVMTKTAEQFAKLEESRQRRGSNVTVENLARKNQIQKSAQSAMKARRPNQFSTSIVSPVNRDFSNLTTSAFTPATSAVGGM